MTFRPDARGREDHPERRQLKALLDELGALLEDVSRGPVLDAETGRRSPLCATELLARARIRSNDGYPSGSGVEGSSRRTATDRDGEKLPGYSDPVGELVAIGVQDSLLTGLRGMVADLRGARKLLLSARKRLVDASPPVPEKGEPGCRVLARFDRWEPVYRSERCRWVYDWWLEFGEDPPDEVVRAWIAHGKITVQIKAMGRKARVSA